MPPKIRIFRAGALLRETQGILGETLLERLQASGVFIDAPCGGLGKCGKCLVRLSPDGGEVKACQTRVEGDADIYLPGEARMQIAGDAPAPRAAAGHSGRLGVAVDIGTTTVVAHLTDLNSGARLATASGVNAQRPYGADVISRIQYCAENGHEVLTRLIREQLTRLIREACGAAGASPGDIQYVSIAANTIMEHLAAGYSPAGMGVVPFRPVSLFGAALAVGEDFGLSPGTPVYFAPAISSYVGGDITAGMLAAGLEEDCGPCVYLDIGTNGEIAMKVGDQYYCCATAAGPAFEGAEISCGMAAVTGAVNHVRWTENGLEYSVIGDAPPRGLCGSGLLDALAVLLDIGAVDETGRLLGADELEHSISARLREVNGKNAFRLSDGVYLAASDVRKLQLAKAAIAAGIRTLIQSAALDVSDVRAFVLAGGFGSYMDQASAARIGLFPKEFLPVSRTMGNMAGEGAALALLSQGARDALEDMRARCKYIELSASMVFNEQFVEQMMFEA